METGYNLKAIKYFRSKNRKRKVIKIFFLVVVLTFCAAYFVDYLAHLPRERHTRNYSYVKKVIHGAQLLTKMTYLKMEATPEDPKGTKLPIVELYVKGKRLDKLGSNLPQSGKVYQKAKIQLNNKVYKAAARYRGDSLNHWAFPNKSWRVRLEKDKFFEGQKYLNFNVPRVRTQISNWLGYKMAETFDNLLVPEARYVHFRVNRKYDGIRLMLEQPDQQFLHRRNLSSGKIYVGDITSEQIYGGVPRKKLFQDPSAWKIRNAYEDSSIQEIEKLISIINTQHNPYSFYKEIKEILDVEATLAYMALLEIVGSIHIDETHNQKFYFNPKTGKLTPIVWDTVAYFWDKYNLDLGSSNLFRVLLSNPECRELKDKILYKAINGKLSEQNIFNLIDKQHQLIKKDIYSFPFKLHANDKGIKHVSNKEWEGSVLKLKETINKRHKFIKSELSKSEASYKLISLNSREYQLPIKVSNRSGIFIDEIKVKTDKNTKITLTRRGQEDLLGKVIPVVNVVNQEGSIKLGDNLFSKRKFKKRKTGGFERKPEIVSSLYVYTLNVTNNAKISKINIIAKNSITGEKVSLDYDDKLQVVPHKENSVWWSPIQFEEPKEIILKDIVDITENLVIDKDTTLIINPGTRLKLKQGISIYLNGGKLIAKGSKDKPIFIESDSLYSNWGSLASNKGSKIELDHVHIKGGSDQIINGVRYSGGVSFHSSKVDINNSSFINNCLSVYDSAFSIRNSEIKSIHIDPLKIEKSSVKKENLKITKLPSLHTDALLKLEPRGTLPRIEREFKFSLSGNGLVNYTHEDLVEGIRKALAESLTDNNWQGNKHFPDSYYTDLTAKDFVFRDIYFDTSDHLNYDNKISYRYRNRYKSLKSYHYHLKKPFWIEAYPYRLEFQAKYDRKEIGGGFSSVKEARFEFRKESDPFSLDNLPPSPPWDIDEFIPYFRSGFYQGIPTITARTITEYLIPRSNRVEFNFQPNLVLLTERFRQHLNLKTPYGSGPNPEQAFIISLDFSKVFSADSYLYYLDLKKRGNKKAPEPVSAGEILEIEVEFERNVSDLIDRSINKAKEKTKLENIRKSFLHDQRYIMQVIKDYFSKQNISVRPVQKSKYVQAYDILYKEKK